MTEVSPVLEALVEEVDALVLVSDLPDSVDAKYWDQWLLRTYEAYLISHRCLSL